MNGHFVWTELMTSDVKAAEAFYGAVLGLETQDAGGGMEYKLLKRGAAMYGGLMAVPEDAKKMGARPSWLGYIDVDDCDAYAEKIKAAGGRVYKEPTDVPGMLRFAAVGDPHGAGFMIMKPFGGPPPDGGVPAPDSQGTVGWRELHAGNGAEAFDFYAKLFGWKKDSEMDMGPMGKYLLWSVGDQHGGMMTKTDKWPMPAWLYYFNVDGLDAAIERVKKAGGTIANGPMEVPGGQWIVQAIDPQGALFALVANAR
jgi:predicted enzyme related to lactoylglutathione lyase